MNGKSSHVTTDSKNTGGTGQNCDNFTPVSTQTHISIAKNYIDSEQKSSTEATSSCNEGVSMSVETTNSCNQCFSELTNKKSVQNGHKHVVKNGHTKSESLTYLENDDGFVTFKGFDSQNVVSQPSEEDNNMPNRKKNTNKVVTWIMRLADELRCIKRDKGRKDDESTYFSYTRM